MTCFFPKVALTAAAFLIAAPAGAQSTMTPAQCDAMLMAGTQIYAAEALASCTAYFQSLARNAAAPGVFSTSRGAATGVTISTSGTGG